ncbi:MAG TPA: hypothetical protein PLT50_01845 [bacterium]|nr:hypothetical protein [bacterium]
MKLIKKIFEIYKVQILLSLTLFITLLALLGIRSPTNIVMTLLGCILGTFILDLDYIIYAYFTDPNQDFSVTLKGFIRHKDYINAISYVFYHKNDVKEKTLHSVLFQVILLALTFFMIFSPLNLFTKTMIISGYANSLYRITESYFSENVMEWFWLLKEHPSQKGVKAYIIISVLALLIMIQFM